MSGLKDHEAFRVIAEWEKDHSRYDDKRFTAVDGRRVKGSPMVLFYAEGDYLPWSIQYRGNGHYYKTKEEAMAYAKERGWKGNEEKND